MFGFSLNVYFGFAENFPISLILSPNRLVENNFLIRSEIEPKAHQFLVENRKTFVTVIPLFYIFFLFCNEKKKIAANFLILLNVMKSGLGCLVSFE